MALPVQKNSETNGIVKTSIGSLRCEYMRVYSWLKSRIYYVNVMYKAKAKDTAVSETSVDSRWKHNKLYNIPHIKKTIQSNCDHIFFRSCLLNDLKLP